MSTRADVQLLCRFNSFVITKNLEGVSQEESLVAPPSGGSCLNWVAGHILSARNGALRLLGEDTIGSEEELAPYKRGASAITADTALPIERIVKDLTEAGTRIASGLERVTEETLAKQTPFEVIPGGGEMTVGQSLVGLEFHEAYHAGQLGVLRRVAGKEGAIA